MSSLIDKIMNDPMIKGMSDTLTEKERAELSVWMNEYILPLEGVLSSIKDLASTEESSESLADAINNIFTEEGVEEVKKCLQEKN